ncbi:MAG: PorV/PorQ family protein [Ignavibacteria bacterium]|nr:PorV/PorQ family protein [Ignavibacteria bacterium]
MKFLKLITIVFLFSHLISNESYSQNDGAGNTGLSFLKTGVGSRSLSMGEAYSSVTEDASAFFYNPARLKFGAKTNILLMHNAMAQDLTTDFIAVKFPLSDKIFMGFGFYTTSISDIEVRNTPGAALETFDSRNLSTGLSFSYSVNNEISIGLTTKLIYEKIYVDEASGVGFDFGTNYSKNNFNLAFVLSNIGSVNELKNQSTKLPSSFRMGGSYKFNKDNFDFNLALEGFKILDGGPFHILTGGEAGYKDLFFVRLGYQSNYENKGITTGIGFKYKALNVDYAFIPSTENFGSGNSFSLGINF